MRVLMTGASSFTGAWLAHALAIEGAEVVGACRRPLPCRDALRRARLALAGRHAHRLVGSAPFGSPSFMRLIEDAGPFDLLCLHGASVGAFRDPGFDPLEAAAADTARAGAVMANLARDGCRRVVVTGSVFEADEGCGEAGTPDRACPHPLPAIGAYGLAKTLSWQILRHEAHEAGMTIGKVSLASPYGPLEKPGLVGDLIAHWLRGEPGRLRRPDRVRDFLPVLPLMRAHARFALALPDDGSIQRLTPSRGGLSVLAFAERLATAMRPRLQRPCSLLCDPDPGPDPEPRLRIGCDPLPPLTIEEEERSWDDLQRFHAR